MIKESSSPWASPVVLLKEKYGTISFCVDYRRLNKVTRKDVYPLPRIDDVLDSLQGAKRFSSMDKRSKYWQIPVAEDDKKTKTSVTGWTSTSVQASTITRTMLQSWEMSSFISQRWPRRGSLTMNPSLSLG